MLLGPNGQPIQSFKKSDAPALGPSYGQWAGRDAAWGQMPGGSVLYFDTSQLTLADFRSMRDHPQINASLSALTFMLHQIDWHVECEDKKIEAMVHENLTQIWTRLVRAMSQSFWAGYSPCAIEYENNISDRNIQISKIKDLVPEECQVRWKKVKGSVQSPSGHRPTFYEYDGIIQRVGGTFTIAEANGTDRFTPGIPAENTFWYPLLMENGNYYGRKLLKSAFMPWYFSILMHLFSNRYFERFGEPLPIGRAPFDDEVPDGKGGVKSGKQAMEDILMNLRNRSVVVLPADREPGSGTYTGRPPYSYDIEYLESQMRGADFERYLSRLDEEMSLSLFTPLLLLRNTDVGSSNLGVQHTQCVSPDTPILCADLIWRDAGDLKAGQEIVAFDEDPMGEGRGVNARCYRTATIEGNRLTTKPSMRLTTDIGDPITASDDHPWLVWRRRNRKDHGNANMGLCWVETKDLQVGDHLAHLGRPWTRDESRDAGWLAGMFDGEGSMVQNTSNHGYEDRGIELTISQNDGPVLDRLKQLMTDRGFSFTDSVPTPTGHGSGRCHKLRINGGFVEVMRFLGEIGPERFLKNATMVWEGRGLRKGYSFELATITSIEDVGDHPISSIRTSGGTFITGGYLSHNTWLWMLNAMTGDMKEYIDRYITERLKAINFSPNAPACRWVPRSMGKESVETIRAVVVELIRGGKIKPDLDELGQALGMSLTEIRQVAAPPPPAPGDPNAPPADPNANPADSRQRTERQRGTGRKGVGEPRATGRLIANRVAGQVDRAFRENRFGEGFEPSLGHHRRFAESLQAEGWDAESAERITTDFFASVTQKAKVAIDLGVEEWAGPQDFMAHFGRVLDTEIDNLQEGDD